MFRGPGRKAILGLVLVEFASAFQIAQHQTIRSNGLRESFPIPPGFARTKPTVLYGSTLWNEDDSTGNYSDKTAAILDERFFVLSTPAIMAAMAFSFYPETSTAFHSFVDTVSGHTWAAVDGGKYLSDLITPALNGPVASFISLLFGTLTSMTVSTLYQRQAGLYQATSDLLEDVRLSEMHFRYFPSIYQEKAIALIKEYEAGLSIYFDEDHVPTAEEIRRARETGHILLEKLLVMLHNISTNEKSDVKVSARIMDQSYETVNRMIQTRSRLISTYDSTFPIWHYGNLAVLAAGICTIFLVLTDRTALQFLGGFQLRLCWAMLIGTISMLAAVLYDLNTPLSGVFQVSRHKSTRSLSVDIDELATTNDETSQKDVVNSD